MGGAGGETMQGYMLGLNSREKFTYNLRSKK